MKTSSKILVFLAALGLKIYLGGGLYRLWSSIHRFFFDRKWKNVVLPKLTVDEAAERMHKFVWKRDGPSELFDAVCTPQKVHAVGFEENKSPHGNDCDEEGIYLANVIQPGYPTIGADFFTVTWYELPTSELKGRFGGHNVCLLRQVDGFRYMDYGSPSKLCKSIDDVADLIIERYAGWDSTGHGTRKAVRVCWCISAPNMKPLLSKMR